MLAPMPMLADAAGGREGPPVDTTTLFNASSMGVGVGVNMTGGRSATCTSMPEQANNPAASAQLTIQDPSQPGQSGARPDAGRVALKDAQE